MVIIMTNQTMNTMFSSDKNYWETPQDFFDTINMKYGFTLDAAASEHNHKVDRYYTEQDDGLSKDWGGRLFFVTRLMEIGRQVYGQKNAMRRRKSQERLSFC